MWRHLSPAITRTEETAQRMMALSERISQTGALLRTQVNIFVMIVLITGIILEQLGDDTTVSKTILFVTESIEMSLILQFIIIVKLWRNREKNNN